MHNTTVSLIKNGDIYVNFYTYKCTYCGKDLPECNPRKDLDNGLSSCCDCAFINGIIGEEEYLKTECYFLPVGNRYAYIEDEKIVVGIGKRRTTERDRRNSPEYAEWRNLVFERDKYECVECGQVGGKLNAHHVKPYKKYVDLRLDVSNGITMCETCHRAAHGSH